jgi:predicted naringenin-chalcone synthase
MRAYGNMSSPTILFVLKELWEKNKPAKGSTIFNASFGPGLTMETMMLEAL